jgi:hypothetical protein
MLKPVKSVGNFFKKVAGKEIEPEKEKSKNRLWLDDKVAENKAARRQERLEEKLRKRQVRADEKNTVYYDEDERIQADENENNLVPAPTLLEETAPPLALESKQEENKKEKKRRWKRNKKGDEQK